MSWSGAGDFFSMGGYGLYVWGSYGITTVLIGAEAWLTLRRRQRALRDALQATEPQR
jgi:heme exporter protein D